MNGCPEGQAWLLGCNGCHKGYFPVNARLEILTVAVEAIREKMAHLAEEKSKIAATTTVTK